MTWQVASHGTSRHQQCLELGVGVVNNEEKAQPRTRKVEEEKKDTNGGSAPNVAPDRGQKFSIRQTNILIALEFTLYHRYFNHTFVAKNNEL